MQKETITVPWIVYLAANGRHGVLLAADPRKRAVRTCWWPSARDSFQPTLGSSDLARCDRWCQTLPQHPRSQEFCKWRIWTMHYFISWSLIVPSELADTSPSAPTKMGGALSEKTRAEHKAPTVWEKDLDIWRCWIVNLAWTSCFFSWAFRKARTHYLMRWLLLFTRELNTATSAPCFGTVKILGLVLTARNTCESSTSIAMRGFVSTARNHNEQIVASRHRSFRPNHQVFSSHNVVKVHLKVRDKYFCLFFF